MLLIFFFFVQPVYWFILPASLIAEIQMLSLQAI